MLDTNEFHEVTNISTVQNGSKKADLFLYTNAGFVFDGWSYQYVEVNLSRGPFIVKGVIIKGNPELRASVNLYRLAIGDDDCKGFDYLYDEDGRAPKNFTGNSFNDDFNTPVITYLDEPITGGCLRVYMKAFTYTISLRMDLIGCFVE